MKKELVNLLEDLIKQNQEQLDFYSSINLTGQMEFYAGKISAYDLIYSFAVNAKEMECN